MVVADVPRVDAGVIASDAGVIASDAVALAVAPRDAAALADARRGRDAGGLAALDRGRDAGVAAPATAPPDAAVTVADAAPADAAVADGQIAIESDAWCVVEVDGHPRGRFQSITRGLRIPTTPGHHVVVCAQTGLASRWTAEVDVVAGQVVVARGALLTKVRVTIAVTHGDGATINEGHYPNGAVIEKAPGHYNVAVIHDGAVEQRTYVDLPQVPACTLRDVPTLDCYP
jgi:hypothetical protein